MGKYVTRLVTFAGDNRLLGKCRSSKSRRVDPRIPWRDQDERRRASEVVQNRRRCMRVGGGIIWRNMLVDEMQSNFIVGSRN